MQEWLPAGLRRVGRSEQGDNADKDMDSSSTKRNSRARDSRVNGMAMRPRSSSAGHEESSASVPPSASAIQWGDVTEVTVPSNREQSTRNGRAADPSGVCDLVAANVRRGGSRSARKRQKKGEAIAPTRGRGNITSQVALRPRYGRSEASSSQRRFVQPMRARYACWRASMPRQMVPTCYTRPRGTTHERADHWRLHACASALGAPESAQVTRSRPSGIMRDAPCATHEGGEWPMCHVLGRRLGCALLP